MKGLQDRVGLDVDGRLRLQAGRLAEEPADPELPGAPDVSAEPVADHERLVGADPRELERAIEHRAMRLAPADAVRARDAVDGVCETEAPPVLADLVIAAPQRVRHEDHGEPLRLAPP